MSSRCRNGGIEPGTRARPLPGRRAEQRAVPRYDVPISSNCGTMGSFHLVDRGCGRSLENRAAAAEARARRAVLAETSAAAFCRWRAPSRAGGARQSRWPANTCSRGRRRPHWANAKRRVALFRRAEACCDECGADRDRAVARRALNALGGHGQSRGPAGSATGGVEVARAVENDGARIAGSESFSRRRGGGSGARRRGRPRGRRAGRRASSSW